jgi:hypothetical protein
MREGGKRRSYETLDKILKLDRLIPMVLDGDPVGGGVNGAALREEGRRGIQIFHVRQN